MLGRLVIAWAIVLRPDPCNGVPLPLPKKASVRAATAAGANRGHLKAALRRVFAKTGTSAPRRSATLPSARTRQAGRAKAGLSSVPNLKLDALVDALLTSNKASVANQKLDALVDALLAGGKAGSFCERYAASQSYRLMQASAPTGEGAVCITTHPYDRSVATYKYLLSLGKSYRGGRLDTGLYDQPVCTEAGLNTFLQKTLAAWQAGVKLLPGCHVMPQSEFIWRRGGGTTCQHVVSEEGVGGSLKALVTENASLTLGLDFRDTSDLRMCPGLSVDALTLSTRRLLDAVYKSDFETLKYRPSQRSLVFAHIPRNAGANIAKVGEDQQVIWPSRMPSYQERVTMPDGSVCPKHHIPARYLSEGDAQIYAQAEVLCVVRHPFERALSEYARLLDEGRRGKQLSELYGIKLREDPPCSAQGLNRFLAKTMRTVLSGRKFALGCHVLPQSEYIWGGDDRQWCQNIIRAEELPGAFDSLMQKKGYPRIQLGERPPISQGMCQNLTTKALSSDVKELLYQVYAEDFKRLSYLRPMQLTAARMQAENFRKKQQAQLPPPPEAQAAPVGLAGSRMLIQGVSPHSTRFGPFASWSSRAAPELGPQPPMFVAVFSRREGDKRRHFVRTMWTDISKRSGGNVTYRFVLCRSPGDALWEKLVRENSTYGDLLVMPCGEGYDQGLLTQKVLAAMWAFKEKFWNHHLFMKVDDDAFISWSKYAPLLAANARAYVYIGVPIGQSVPCRNSSYKWYEPYETFPDALFPKSMAGGSGYVLGRKLVQDILESGVGEANVLYNEDRAVGVWVDKLRKYRNVDVHFVNVLGIDGWWGWDYEHPLDNWKRWDEYPYFVHHGLLEVTIHCLARMDAAGLPSNDMSRCLLNEVGITHEALHCAAETAWHLAQR